MAGHGKSAVVSLAVLLALAGWLWAEEAAGPNPSGAAPEAARPASGEAQAAPAAQPADKPAAAGTAEATREAATDTPGAEAKVNQTGPGNERAALVALLKDRKLQWYQKICELAYGPMARGTQEQYDEAEKQLLAITDPAALEPMAVALYTPYTRWRSSFLKAVMQYAKSKDEFASPVAVTYLSDIAVLDESAVLRGKARSALMQADTPRYPERLRYQLVSCPTAAVRSRAAEILADLKDKSMLWALIELLTTDEWRLKGLEIESRTVQMDIRTNQGDAPTFRTFPLMAYVPLGPAVPIDLMLPTVRTTSISTTVFAPAGIEITKDWELVSVRHPAMLLALEKLTGKHFGYDKQAWRNWLRTQAGEGGQKNPYGLNWDEK